MPLELRWKPSLSATCVHAAVCQSAGIRAADPELAAVLDAPAAALLAEIADAAWPRDAFLAQLAGLASEYDNNLELVTRAAAKLRLEATGSIGRAAGAVADLEAAMLRWNPQMAEELALRCGPIRQQWEARGPGLLHQVGRLTDPAVVPESAELVLVAPYAGGHGIAYPQFNRAAWEAVLVNPHAELPETVRLAWLVCQLNGDLPRFADATPPGRHAEAFRIAMIPPVLAAAEVVELAICDAPTIATALDAWRLSPALPRDAPERLLSWWSAWLEGAGAWPVAVAALARLLA